MWEKLTEFFNGSMLWAMAFFCVGHIFGWYTTNSQFVWEFWKDKPLLANIVFGIPAGMMFWYGTRYVMQSTPELWTARFTAAVISYSVFPLMTWFYLGESMFTIKTMLCVCLAFMILIVQILF